MKKNNLLIVIVLICVVFFGWKLIFVPVFFRPAAPSDDAKTMQIQKPSVSVALNYGDSFVTYDGVHAETAFDALSAVCTGNNIVLEKKQYDFGVFVEKIGDKANTNDKAWIYYVNGKSGEVAADKQALISGDTIEWRYQQPLY
jgi:hypothetical protein